MGEDYSAPMTVPDPSLQSFEVARIFTLPALLVSGGYPRGGSHVSFMPELLYLYGVVLFVLFHALPTSTFSRLFARLLPLIRTLFVCVILLRGGFLFAWAVNAAPELWGAGAYMVGRAEVVFSVVFSILLFCLVGGLEKLLSAVRLDRRCLLVAFFLLMAYASTTTFHCYEAASFI